MWKATILLVLSLLAFVECYRTNKEIRKARNTSLKETWWSRNVLGQKEPEKKETKFNVSKTRSKSVLQLIEHLAPRYLLLANLLIFGVILLVGLYSVMHHFIRKIPLPLFAIMV